MTKLPKKITVLHHYGESVYFDGLLVAHYGVGPTQCHRWGHLCQLLGIEFQNINVPWQDMPGARQDSAAVHHPPKELRVVEERLATLAEERRLAKISILERELSELKRGKP